MRRFWTATFLVLGTMTLGTLLALRSGPLVIHTAQWAVVTLTDYRLDLREPLRAGASAQAMQAQIAAVWRARLDRYSEQRAELQGKALPVRVQMYAVGG